MKLTYFGTAAAEGWPALFCRCEACAAARKLGGKNIRTRSQSLVNDDLLIDFPADTYDHMLHGGLNLDAVRYLLVTHAHEDHFYPEDLANRQEPYASPRAPHVLEAYGNDAVCAAYHRVASIGYNAALPDVVSMTEVQPYEAYIIGRYTVYPMLADHNQVEKCLIYVIKENDTGKTLLYAHDTGYLVDSVWDFITEKGFVFDLVSLDCTHGKEPARRNHMGLQTDAEIKERLIREGHATESTVFVVNHFSHNCNYLTHEEIEQDAKQYGMLVSYDTMSVEV